MAVSKVVLGVIGATAVAGAVAVGAVVASGGGSSSKSNASAAASTTTTANATAVSASTSSGPLIPDPSCQQESSVKSVTGDTKFNLTFVNNTAETVQTLWLNYQGGRVFYRQIPAGTSYVQPTFITHPWIVADLAGKCLTMYVTDGRQQTVTVPVGSTAPATPTTVNTNAGASLGNASVVIKADDTNAFAPFAVDVTTTSIVEWQNTGTYEHNITFDDPSVAPFNELHLTVGHTWQVKFPKAGTYTYVCTIHTDMKGTINVH